MPDYYLTTLTLSEVYFSKTGFHVSLLDWTKVEVQCPHSLEYEHSGRMPSQYCWSMPLLNNNLGLCTEGQSQVVGIAGLLAGGSLLSPLKARPANGSGTVATSVYTLVQGFTRGS